MIKHLKNVKRGVSLVKEIKDDPLGFIIDRIIAFTVNIFVPIPFIGELAATYKVQFLFLLLGLIIAILTIFLSIGVMIATAPSKFLPSVASSVINFVNGIFSASDQKIADELKNFRESGFTDTDTPIRNPFGGTGMSNVYTTVDFNVEEDFTLSGVQYSEIEQGIDIVPNDLYYSSNDAAKRTGEPIIFDTLTGTTHSYTDNYGANTVEVTNNAGTIKIIYIHMKQVLIGNNVVIHPGQPIGVMGSTGLSTGDHLEYQVRLNEGGSWVAVNPINYIQ